MLQVRALLVEGSAVQRYLEGLEALAQAHAKEDVTLRRKLEVLPPFLSAASIDLTGGRCSTA